MSEVVRLTLVSHAMTDAMAAGRFPTDEPLNAVGHRQVDASIDLGVTDRAYCGPEKRARQTAELLGLHASIDNRLADLDCGRWRGDVVSGVQSDDLAIWLTDPTRAPHGGESVIELIDRVRGWMDSLTTHRSRHGRRHASVCDPGRDLGRAQRASEVVLAHRHCPGEPHGHALSRARVDAAVQPVIRPPEPDRTPRAQSTAATTPRSDCRSVASSAES